VLLTVVLGAMALGIGWAEQSNGKPSLESRRPGGTVTIGVPADIRIDAVDPDEDGLQFRITGGDLPPGLALSTDSGRITGVPRGPAGTYVASLTVSDGRGGVARSPVVVTVVGGPSR
jgi:hypothetical protein